MLAALLIAVGIVGAVVAATEFAAQNQGELALCRLEGEAADRLRENPLRSIDPSDCRNRPVRNGQPWPWVALALASFAGAGATALLARRATDNIHRHGAAPRT